MPDDDYNSLLEVQERAWDEVEKRGKVYNEARGFHIANGWVVALGIFLGASAGAESIARQDERLGLAAVLMGIVTTAVYLLRKDSGPLLEKTEMEYKNAYYFYQGIKQDADEYSTEKDP